MAEIQDNFVLLCNELDVDSILPFLRQKKLLTTEEYERLLFSGLSLKEKRERLLLSVIPRKGRTHLETFCTCLVLSGQRDLAKKLDKNIDITYPQPIPSPVTSPGSNQHQPYIIQPRQPPQPQPTPFLSPLVVPSVSARPHPLSVLIVYTKDHHLQTLQPPFKRSADQYCEEVDSLVDTLTLFSSVLASGAVVTAFKCVYDSESVGFVPDWLQWFEEALGSADCILLLCSPVLFMSLKHQGVLEMARGKCNIGSLAHYMTSKCCIPVFLNMPRQIEWIPVGLRAANSYELHVNVLHREIGSVDGMTEQQFNEAAVHCLGSNRQLSQLNQLLQVLRREPPAPMPPQPVIQVPPIWSPPDSSLQSNYPSSVTYAAPPPEGIIPDATLCEIAAEVTNIWEHLGVKLGVPFSKIQTARSSHPNNLQMAVITMLRMWQSQKRSEATPKALKKALLELRYRRVAMNYFPKD